MAKDKPRLPGIVEMQPEHDGPLMPDDLARIQATSDDLEPEPKVARLHVHKAHPDGPEPPPPSPPTALASPTPRFVHQNERAPQGLRRYKIRCVNLGEQPTRYLLAADEDTARRHYLKATGINSLLAAIPEFDRDGRPCRPSPRLSVRALQD